MQGLMVVGFIVDEILRAIPCKNQPNPYGGSARMVMDFLHTLRIY